MKSKRTRRIDVRRGYDLWAPTYDTTPNPVVVMDSRFALQLLRPSRGERILDAGCGTGRNLRGLLESGAIACGVDFSTGMLQTARRHIPGAPLAQADLSRLPFRRQSFDAILCALIGEHMRDLRACFEEFRVLLKKRGRMVFTVYHPDLAAAGKEANFEIGDTQYKLGAIRYGVADYVAAIEGSGFGGIHCTEYKGDAELARALPAARKWIGHNMLLAIAAVRRN
ncbi:MAG TPA: class I SAM-dependent methyltransferase [Candidatus Binataceae bacterium]|nr:class I SAM-dependent methyltransferase [Candidatus Binataceae bacterium]